MEKLYLIIPATALLIACGGSTISEDTVAEKDEIAVTEEAVEEEMPADTAELIKGKWEYYNTSTHVMGQTTDMKVFETWTMEFGDSTVTEFTDLGGDTNTISGTYTIARDSLFRTHNPVGVAIKEISADKLVLHTMKLSGFYFRRTTE